MTSELHEFQMSVAARWVARAGETADSFAQFFFLFAALNALYFVRCNLVHGSKVASGDDEALIANSAGPLRALVEESLRISQNT